MKSAEVFGSLRLHCGPFHIATDRAAYEALLRDVLKLSPSPVPDDAWTPFAFFDTEGRCVANVDAAILPLIADGASLLAGGIRSVAVAPQWRGYGLFRTLMTEALAWCDARATGPVLLYTAEPALYERFGFRLVEQHAFCGLAPNAPATRTVGASHRERPALMTSIIGRRASVSLQAALMVGADLFMANVAGDDDLEIAYVESLESVVVLETSGDTLVIVDIAAPRIPPLAALLAALGRASTRIKTLFPPDRLGWQGEPVGEATGLMARGVLPDALKRPFMFPPTAEF